MPMDDYTKKLFAQLDDPMRGIRGNALEALHRSFEASDPKQSFVNILYELENSVPLQQYTDEVNQHNKTKLSLQQYMAANAKWAQQHARYKATVYFTEVILPQIAMAGVVVAPICLALWMVFSFFSWLTGESKAVRVTVNQGMMSMLEGWKFAVGETSPEAFDVAGKPYWVIVRGELEPDTHTDRKARNLMLRCLYLYAEPAIVESQSYRKPEPYSWSGSLSWPQRAKFCKPAGYADAIQKVENEQPAIQSDFGNVSENPLGAGQDNAATNRAGRTGKGAGRSR